MTGPWFVCDMDDGVLRREASRSAAVAWWLAHNLTTCVRSRYSYGPGRYEYQVGATDEDSASAWIVSKNKMAGCGWDAGQEPLYPLDGAFAHELAHEEVPPSADDELDDELLVELRAAHEQMEQLTEDLAYARQRRRTAATSLLDAGRGTSWIARALGVTPQAVDQFVRYKERAAADRGPSPVETHTSRG